MYGSALGYKSSSAPAPHLGFIIAERPPIGFAEPWSICKVVTPPDRLRYKLMSSGFITSSIVTSAEEFCPPSLILDAPICECSSITPLVRCLPVPSITRAPGASPIVPTALIFPLTTQTLAFCRIPSASLVQTVRLVNKTFSKVGSVLKPNPLFG